MVKLNTTTFSAKKKSALAVRQAVKGEKSANKGSFSSSTLYLTVGDEKVYLGKIFGSKMNSTEKLDYMLSLVASGQAGLEIQKHESLKPEGKLKALLDAFDKAEEDNSEDVETEDEDVFEDDEEEEE